MKQKTVICVLSSISVTILLSLLAPLLAQNIPLGMFDAMRWRLIGPFRAGRITSVCGVSGQPNVYYVGTPGGGVWKTEDAGRVWKPIFDSVPIPSIGAVAVAPSNAQIIYVATGEQTRGDGVYRSTDAGATWTNIGLRETHAINGLVIDPHDPNIVLIGAAGDSTSGGERGVYKTTDGGENWKKVLYKDEETGVVDLESDPDNPNILLAALWTRAVDPFDPGEPMKSQDAAIYKSTDEGSTWQLIPGKGLPTSPMRRVGVAIAPGTNGQRVYAIVEQGLFRSENGGDTWQRSTNDPRVRGDGYFSRVFVDPTNASNVYVAQTSMYRSSDGGQTFEAWQGAPSGDDYHVLWIDPRSNQHMILGVDQGAAVSVNGGSTWSSWYNQPTGQFYHVSTDRQFPYHVYGAQQDSGTASVSSRSDVGEITYRDWDSVGGFEFAYIVPDPANPNYVYTGGWYGSVLRAERSTGQITHLFIRSPKYRTYQMAPIAFAPQDPHTLYIGAQYVLKSKDAGVTWKEASPDLTQKPAQVASSNSEPPNRRSDVITTMSFSTLKAGELWVGTGNGIIQVSRDGKSWQNVTIPNLPDHTQITVIEASHHDESAAYAVTQTRHETRPSIYRTRDYGHIWQPISMGLPAGENVRVVRGDPQRSGLLYAGTDRGVYISFDDGGHWQSLQLNLPVTPVTDLDVHGDDLVASTFGRSLWILDDVTPLRQFSDKLLQSDVTLLPPEPAIRTRWDVYQDTPLPPETPAGHNPPDGAIIDYFLKQHMSGSIKLQIFDAKNNLVREYTDNPPSFEAAPANVPDYWFASPPALSEYSGINRFAWDLRYPPPKALNYSYYGQHLDYIEYTLADHAIPGDFPHEQPLGPYAVPGNYSVVLTVNGQSYRQPLQVTMDPRVHASQADLVQQLDTERSISAQMDTSYDGYWQIEALRNAIADRQKTAASDAQKKDLADALKSLDGQAAQIENGNASEVGIGSANRDLSRLATMAQSSDTRPAAQVQDGVLQTCQMLAKRVAEWRELNEKTIAPVNDLLRKYSLTPLPVASSPLTAPACQ